MENVFERITVMMDSENETIELAHIPDKLRREQGETSGTIPVGLSLEQVEAQAIAATLKTNGGNITRTSEILGVTRKTLRAKIKKYNLTKPGEAEDED